MKIDLNGKRALVGGSTGGIGKAIAIELSKCGANVTLMARNAEKLKKTITELSKNEISNHNYLVVDFNDFNDLKMVMEDFFKKKSSRKISSKKSLPERFFLRKKLSG